MSGVIFVIKYFQLGTKKVGAYPLTIGSKSIILYMSLKNMKEAFKTKLSKTFEVVCFLPHTATAALIFG